MARVLALDVGERRIGVAVSDPTETLARPLTAIVRASRQQDFEAIARLVEEYEVECIVVGLPLSLDGSEGPQARQIRRYAQRLAQAITVPLVFWDERYSTVTAEEMLRAAGKRSRRTRRGQRRPARGDVDAAAAAVLLQAYLDAQASSSNEES